MDVKNRLQEIAQARYGLELSQCGDSQLYHALLQLTQELETALRTMEAELPRYQEAEERARELCREMGVELDVRRRVCDLGVAYQQIVEILKAVSRNTEFIIMDEPTAPLTIKETEVFFKIIEKLNIRGIIEVLDGKVVTVDKARGADKTFQKMLERIASKAEDFSQMVIGIAHFNNPEMAEKYRAALDDLLHPARIYMSLLNPAIGVYCDNGGIVISVAPNPYTFA